MTSVQSPPRTSALSAGAKYIEHARAIVPVLQSEAAAIEAQRKLTPRVLDELASRNLLQSLLAPARGEGDLSVVDVLSILETLATGDASTAWDVMAAMGGTFVSSFLPDATCARIFATPGDAVASAVGRIGKATACDGGYMVDAKWPFLSGSPHASWIGGLCAVFDGDEPRTDPAGGPHIVMPLLPKERVQLKDNWYATGLAGTGSHEAEVQGMFVPRDEVADFANGPRPGLPLLYSIPEDSIAPLAAASVAVGIARAAVEAFRATSRGLVHSSGAVVSEMPLAQVALATAEAMTDQAASHLATVARALDDGLAAGRLPDEAFVRRVSLAATVAVEGAITVVSTLYRAAGSRAVFRGSVLDRALRDVYTLGAHRMVQRENYLHHGVALFD